MSSPKFSTRLFRVSPLVIFLWQLMRRSNTLQKRASIRPSGQSIRVFIPSTGVVLPAVRQCNASFCSAAEWLNRGVYTATRT
ncbi:hypothetical protein F5B21DRAFT_481953 [Xylaria acuta]|nr:hypothetical protein F5B21DRAFT_481953 [Xylaria acuta]